MIGPAKILVSSSSATHNRPWEIEPQHAQPINRSHSEMVKFTSEYDKYYKITSHFLKNLSIAAQKAIPRSMSAGQGKAFFFTPFSHLAVPCGN